MGFRNEKCTIEIFRKKIWKNHLVELEKLENNIFDQIRSPKNVGSEIVPKETNFQMCTSYFKVPSIKIVSIIEILFLG